MSLGLVVAALPVLVGIELWTAVFGMWAVFLLGISVDFVVLAFARPRVSIDSPPAVGVGDNFDVKVTLNTRGGRGFQGHLRAEVTPPLLADGGVTIRSLPRSSLHRLALNAPRRGAGEIKAIWSRLAGPLGLFRRTDRIEIPQAEVTVLPNFAKVRQMALEHRGVFQSQGGLIKERVHGEGGEFDALQAYAVGMDMRNVDWKTSARHQALRVRRFRLERSQRVILCLDTGRLMADPIDGMTRLDHGIHAALLLAFAALKNGDLVGLQAYGPEPGKWLPPTSGMKQLKMLRRVCGGIHPHDDETNHVLGLHSLLTHAGRRSLVVVFTEFTDPTTAELMVEHIGHIAQRHLVIFVALDDPTIEEPLRDEPVTAEHLAAGVVAGSLKHDRQAVLHRLKKMGVHVVDGPPGEAAISLLTRYVRIKRRRLIG